MKNRSKLNLYFFLFSITILLLLIFPLYNFGNKVNPIILGIPFSLGWIIICIIIQFLGILLFLVFDKDKKEQK